MINVAALAMKGNFRAYHASIYTIVLGGIVMSRLRTIVKCESVAVQLFMKIQPLLFNPLHNFPGLSSSFAFNLSVLFTFAEKIAKLVARNFASSTIRRSLLKIYFVFTALNPFCGWIYFLHRFISIFLIIIFISERERRTWRVSFPFTFLMYSSNGSSWQIHTDFRRTFRETLGESWD